MLFTENKDKNLSNQAFIAPIFLFFYVFWALISKFTLYTKDAQIPPENGLIQSHFSPRKSVSVRFLLLFLTKRIGWQGVPVKCVAPDKM